MAIKIEVAPAMAADPRQPDWGMKNDEKILSENESKEEAALYGCSLKTLPLDCRRVTESTLGQCTARELTQLCTGPDGEKHMPPMPKECKQEAPEEINCYGDGSLLHGKGDTWRIGGAGCWWPERSDRPNEDEANLLA